jgi:hypothetical protein
MQTFLRRDGVAPPVLGYSLMILIVESLYQPVHLTIPARARIAGTFSAPVDAQEMSGEPREGC